MNHKRPAASYQFRPQQKAARRCALPFFCVCSRTDGAAAQHGLSLIKHHGLPGRDGPLGFLEGDADPAAGQRLHHGFRLLLGIPGFGGHLQRTFQMAHGDEVYPVGGQFPGVKGAVGSQNHGAGLQILAHHIHRYAGADAQSLALAGGVALQPLMTAQYPALQIHKVPGDRDHAAVAAQKRYIVPVGNEADVLAARWALRRPACSAMARSLGFSQLPTGSSRWDS